MQYNTKIYIFLFLPDKYQIFAHLHNMTLLYTYKHTYIVNSFPKLSPSLLFRLHAWIRIRIHISGMQIRIQAHKKIKIFW